MDFLRVARELEARDVEIAAALERVGALQADVEELHAHARARVAFLAALPEERARLAAALAEATAELEAREADVAAAEQELARAKEGEPQAAARRSVTRARDAAASARRRAERVEDERGALERGAVEAEERAPKLAARAVELSTRLADTPRATAVPPAEPVEWTSRARAALFVAAGSLESERERVVREANELAAAVLGEGMYASVGLVRQRLERA
jgi:chromosome segregation ATPase